MQDNQVTGIQMLKWVEVNAQAIPGRVRPLCTYGFSVT